MTGFIGAGNMANAIIKGMVSSGAAEGKDIAVYDIHPEKREKAPQITESMRCQALKNL